MTLRVKTMSSGSSITSFWSVWVILRTIKILTFIGYILSISTKCSSVGACTKQKSISLQQFVVLTLGCWFDPKREVRLFTVTKMFHFLRSNFTMVRRHKHRNVEKLPFSWAFLVFLSFMRKTNTLRILHKMNRLNTFFFLNVINGVKPLTDSLLTSLFNRIYP